MNDIEVLEKFTKIVKGKDYNAENGWHGYYDAELIAIGKAIENLLKERQSDKERIKDLEEINEAHKKENGELREELESIKEIYYTQKEIETYYIPKSLIIEKIEPVINKLERNGFVGYADELRDISEELLSTKM